MEKLLHKLARQLDSLDEASLMALWSKYATVASHFEPTRRWEDACLVFGLIQAKRWKNQLFNYSWSQQRQAPSRGRPDLGDDAFITDFDLDSFLPQTDASAPKAPCRVLNFRPLAESDCHKTDKEDGD